MFTYAVIAQVNIDYSLLGGWRDLYSRVLFFESTVNYDLLFCLF